MHAVQPGVGGGRRDGPRAYGDFRRRRAEEDLFSLLPLAFRDRTFDRRVWDGSDPFPFAPICLSASRRVLAGSVSFGVVTKI